jgi:glycosyltransferase involved in cell wall biosynthesis
MTKPYRLAFIGNSLPRRCGIATFTTALQQAVAANSTIDTSIIAMTDKAGIYTYPPIVAREIRQNSPADYDDAAAYLNETRTDVVCLQHEFGIFGGEAGSEILRLASQLSMPVVTTFHTVLAQPSSAQRSVVDRLVELSARVVVMAEKGRALLRSTYHVPDSKIVVIPHGIPDHPFVGPDDAKAEAGLSGRPVILTFGLLSPNKGIELMINAMPEILRRCPNAVYVILGATHPNLVRDDGEAYRERLQARVAELGIEESIIFLDQFVDHATLMRYITMCDVYVTPYVHEAQMTSGTLAYSFGHGRAVVSTPYWHANELLADGNGMIVPFNDVPALGDAVAGLLTDTAARLAMGQRAYEKSRSMTWANTAARYEEIFEAVRRESRLRIISRQNTGQIALKPQPLPEMRITALRAMCDDTGIYQHAVYCVPDRAHGYCVDDNARGLLLASTISRHAGEALPEPLTMAFAAFVQHAWNPDTRRFRNFMSFDRRWLEDTGSEDSHGRTLWALGECARGDAMPARRRWAANLFAEALDTVEGFSSPRSWAFTLLGLNAIGFSGRSSSASDAIGQKLADRLMAQLEKSESSDWVWFEDGLAYDNARLCQALIATGSFAGRTDYVQAGLRSLRWLMVQQQNPRGQFRPVGSKTFGDIRTAPRAFDQQPLEAAATVSACLAAWRIDGQREWRPHAERAFAWFMGGNDLSEMLVNPETGSCLDGLHPERPNENQGAESVLSYLLALSELSHAQQSRSETSPNRLRPSPEPRSELVDFRTTVRSFTTSNAAVILDL